MELEESTCPETTVLSKEKRIKNANSSTSGFVTVDFEKGIFF